MFPLKDHKIHIMEGGTRLRKREREEGSGGGGEGGVCVCGGGGLGMKLEKREREEMAAVLQLTKVQFQCVSSSLITFSTSQAKPITGANDHQLSLDGKKTSQH